MYETEKHLEKERHTALFFEQIFQCTLRKLPIKYQLDYAAERQGSIKAFIEIKCPNYTFEQFKKIGCYKISFAKWCAAEQMSRVAGVPFVLVVGLLDQVRYMRTDDFMADSVTWWGRTDRNDSQDMEPAVVLHLDRFVMLR